MAKFRIVFVSLLLLSVLQAHDLYLLPNSFHVHPATEISVAFHNGDSFPESEVAPRPERLQDAELHWYAGARAIKDLQIVGNETVGTVKVTEQGSLYLSVRTVPNFIELASGKFSAYLNEEGLGKVIDWRIQHHETGRPGRERYTKFAKALLVSGSSTDFYRQPLGSPIEIVPLADPALLHAGAVLPVRVLLRGKAAPGLQLESAWARNKDRNIHVIGRTNNRGEINVPITNAGKWRLHSLMMERCADSETADWESLWASLTFEVR